MKIYTVVFEDTDGYTQVLCSFSDRELAQKAADFISNAPETIYPYTRVYGNDYLSEMPTQIKYFHNTFYLDDKERNEFSSSVFSFQADGDATVNVSFHDQWIHVWGTDKKLVDKTFQDNIEEMKLV